MKAGKHAFTLLEIMIVVMIIGLLAGLAIPSIRKASDHAKEKSCIGNLRVIQGAVTMYATEYNKGSTDSITGTEWSSILNFIDDSTPSCPQGDVRYEKPATYGTKPVCPNASLFADHELPD